MKELWLVRHGESESNLAERWQGQGDSPLSENGLAQADALGARLASLTFDAVYASDLSRAKHTALAVHATPTLDPRLREVDLGAWEGLTFTEVRAQHAEDITRLRRGENIKIGGGESWDDVATRVCAAAEEIVAKLGDGERAIVFSHGGAIGNLLRVWLDVPTRYPRPVGRLTNTAVSVLEIEDTTRRFRVLNDATHHTASPPWLASFEPSAEELVVDVTSDPAGLSLEALSAVLEAAQGSLQPLSATPPAIAHLSASWLGTATPSLPMVGSRTCFVRQAGVRSLAFYAAGAKLS